MRERDMHEPFIEWIRSRSVTFTDELDTGPCSPRFDFVSIEEKGDSSYLIIYELKVKDAKNVIYQANMAMLWCDHAYVVMPKTFVHLAEKRRDRFAEWVGLLSLDMRTNVIDLIFEPKSMSNHMVSRGMRHAIIQNVIAHNIADHCTPRAYPKRGY